MFSRLGRGQAAPAVHQCMFRLALNCSAGAGRGGQGERADRGQKKKSMVDGGGWGMRLFKVGTLGIADGGLPIRAYSWWSRGRR